MTLELALYVLKTEVAQRQKRDLAVAPKPERRVRYACS